MKLREIMTRDVVVLQPDDSLQSAAKKMRERNIGFLPVCDGEELIGVISGASGLNLSMDCFTF